MKASQNNPGNARPSIYATVFISNYKLIAFILVMIIALPSYFWLIAPLYQEWKDTQQRILTADNEGADLQKEFKEINAAISNFTDVKEEDIARVSQLLPPAAQKKDMYALLERITQENGLILKDISMEEEVESNLMESAAIAERNLQAQKKTENAWPKEIAKVDIAIAVLGVNYESLKRYIKTIENNIKLMDITGLNFSPATGAVNLQITTYFKK